MKPLKKDSESSEQISKEFWNKKMNKKRKISAVILAAGKGSRMKIKETNKVTVLFKNKPLISHTVDLLEKLKINPILVVVGYAKESVKNALKNSQVVFVEQKEQLGTGHALNCAINNIPDDSKDVIVLYGDDSYLYSKDLLQKIINMHMLEKAMLTFLTIQVENASGMGRIIRDNKGDVIDIIEEKDATVDQIKIKEINPNCYIFQSSFLKKYLARIPKSPVTDEYYLPSLIKMGRENNEKIQAINGGFLTWRGINTKKDLEEAGDLYAGQ